MKNITKAVLICICMILLWTGTATAANGKNFEDVSEDSWYYEAVDFVTSRGLFIGTSDKKFSPELHMTRGMFVTVLGRYWESISENNSVGMTDKSNFVDIAGNEYYASYATWAYNNKIANGTGGGKFSPELTIKREDAAKMSYAYADFAGIDLSYDDSVYSQYSDINTVSAYAVTPLKWAANNGIIKGYDGKIVPSGFVTRAQAAQIFLNLYNMDHGITNKRLFNIEPNQVSSIYIMNASTGKEVNVENKDQIESIINEINGFTYTTSKENEYVGWIFLVKVYLYGKDGGIVFSVDTISIDYGYNIYTAADDKYLETLYSYLVSLTS